MIKSYEVYIDLDKIREKYPQPKDYRYNVILETCKAKIARKPKMVEGKAIWMGEWYQSLDDAWDWFESDLNKVKWDHAERVLTQQEHKKLRKELEEA